MNKIYQQGLCVDSEQAHLFFSERPEELSAAQALCFRCPVRLNCLEHALDSQQDWGVWGGVIFWDGELYHRKRARGRPRKLDSGLPLEANRAELYELVRSA